MLQLWYDLSVYLLPGGAADFVFLKNALAALLLLGVMCAAMGVRVVGARMSFFTDAVGHGALAGLGLGAVLSVGLSNWLEKSVEIDGRLSLAVFSMAFGLAVVWLTRASRLSSDSATGVLFSLVTAAGLVLVKMAPQRALPLSALMYGSVLTVGPGDLLALLILTAATLLFLAWSANRLALIDLDQRLAQAHGVRAALLEYAYAALLALVVAATAKLAGILLVTAMLILPAAAARGFSRSWGGQFWWAQVIAATSALAGLWIASWEVLDAPVGAMVVLTAGLWFGVSVLAAWKRAAT